jgi:hypothetical protein
MNDNIRAAYAQIDDYESRIKELKRDIAGMKRARDQTDLIVCD